MTKQRAEEIERKVFYRYLDQLERDLEKGGDIHVAFEVGRTLGYMQKTLQDELEAGVADNEST